MAPGVAYLGPHSVGDRGWGRVGVPYLQSVGFHIQAWFLTWEETWKGLSPSGPGSSVALTVGLCSGCSHLLLSFPPGPLHSFLPTSLVDTVYDSWLSITADMGTRQPLSGPSPSSDFTYKCPE